MGGLAELCLLGSTWSTLAELFVFGSIWFWALVAVEIIILFCCVEWENGIGATISVAVFMTILYFMGGMDFITYIKDNPWNIVIGAASYIVLGIMWGIVKWYLFVKDQLDDYEELKVKWLEEHHRITNTKVVPANLREEWKSYLSRGQFRAWNDKRPPITGVAPDPKKHADKIIRWMTFWVISLIWSIVNDFVKRIFKEIYKRIAGALYTMSLRAFSRTKQDFEIEAKSNESNK